MTPSFSAKAPASRLTCRNGLRRIAHAIAWSWLLAHSAHSVAGQTLAAPSAMPPAAAVPAPAADVRCGEAVLCGRVLRVHDGDSFTLLAVDGREAGVRIAGIDAPERTQDFADVSRRALRGRIDRRDVRVEVVKIDPYGRFVGRVFVDGHDVGFSQLQAGLAWHFVRYDGDLAPAERKRYALAERSARERSVGLWREPEPVAPWSFRKQRR